MICYFDTSAVIPLLIKEHGSPTARLLWEKSDRVTSCRLLYVETAAALALAERVNRISRHERIRALDRFESMWPQLDVADVTDALVRRAAALSASHGLRGYDAVHCAAAERLREPDLVVAVGDKKLRQACRDLDLATADTNGWAEQVGEQTAAPLNDDEDRAELRAAREDLGSDDLW